MTTQASTHVLRMGTRGSALALAQSSSFAAALSEVSGASVRTVGITTQGDTSNAAIATMGSTGVFVQAVRAALLAEEIDFAVHSYKDLPTAVPDGITIAAVPVREDPRDAVVAADGRTLAQLPPGARVGTGSPRRAGQLLSMHPQLDVVPLRGNVDSRIGRVRSGQLDAVVVAAAGLARLGRLAEASQILDPDAFVPAPAQGALAVECRSDDPGLLALLSALDDRDTRCAVEAERAVLARLEAGCSAPVGAHARIARSRARLELCAVITSPDGRHRTYRTMSASPTDATATGHTLADTLLADHNTSTGA